MIDSISNSLGMNAAQNAQTERTQQLSRTEKTKADTQPAKTERQRTENPRKQDRVELSSGAREYLSAAATDETTASQSVSAKTTVDESSVSVDVSTEDENITSSELYSYTDKELLDLVLDGDISRSDYNAELAKRSAE